MDAAPKGGLIQKLCGKATVTVYHKVELGYFTGFAFLRGIDAADRACAVGALNLPHNPVWFSVSALESCLLYA